MPDNHPSPVLVSDFDGTMTRDDFYSLVADRLVPAGTPDYWGQYVTGRITHFEALRRIFAAIRSSEDELSVTARAMKVDPGLGSAVRRLKEAGWRVVVASAGCEWYIRRLLADQGLRPGADLELHANPGHVASDGSLQMELPRDSAYFSESTGIDKLGVLRQALDTGGKVAFAGDGRPDYDAALQVPAHLRFACGWLADNLNAHNIEYRGFTAWSEIADALLAL